MKIDIIENTELFLVRYTINEFDKISESVL